MEETFSEDKSRDYFIDLLLGLEYCECWYSMFLFGGVYMYVFICVYMCLYVWYI